MVLLVLVAQALEDLNGQVDVRLRHVDRLEAALQGGVLLDVLAVLVERGGADGLQLAAGQLGLQDGGGVDGAFRGARADEGVDLVDEQDDVAALVNLLEHLLQALLEVTAVTGTGDEGSQVQRVQLLVLEGLRDAAIDDVQRQALDDRGLADARLADEHRVVLGAAREHLHDALDFLLAADDGVELAFPGGDRQVAAELVEDQGAGLVVAFGDALAGGGADGALLRATGFGVVALEAGQQLDDLLADARQVGAELDQDLRGDALALADEAEQDVLGADVLVAELQGLAEGVLEDLLGARGEGDVAGRRLGAAADDVDDFAAHGLQRDAHGFQGLRGDAVTFADQAEQDVLGADVIVVELAGLVLRQDDDAPGAVGEPLEHHSPRLSSGIHITVSLKLNDGPPAFRPFGRTPIANMR